MTIIKISLIVIAVLALFCILTNKFVNPYKLIFVFGKKGSGKSTLLAKLTDRYLKRGWTIYSTEATQNDCKVNYLNPHKIYQYDFPKRSCVFVDEVSLIWHNRDFKTMDKNVIEFFRFMRKKGVRCYFFSQSFDVDKVLRELVDEFYLVEKYLRVFVVARRIVRKPVVVHPSAEAPARIDDDMIVDPLWTFFLGGRLFAFIPYWAKKYDTTSVAYAKKEVSTVSPSPSHRGNPRA